MAKKINEYSWFKRVRRTVMFQPYDINPNTKGRNNGKASPFLRALNGVPGVYVIYTKNRKRILYVGMADNLYTNVMRRFQTWNDKNFNRITYDPKKGSFVECLTMKGCTRDQVASMETYLIELHRPSGNRRQAIDNQLNYGLNGALVARAGKAYAKAKKIDLSADAPF